MNQYFCIQTKMPLNAQYTSPDIQNELIDVMTEMVSEEIVERVKKAGMFSLMADETYDKQRVEDLAVAVRFVDQGVPEERVLSVLKLDKRDAKTIASKIFDDFAHKKLPKEMIFSQCHDGASVMSGIHNGVQAQVSAEVGRPVPYVHCFAHQLHLVVVHSLSSVDVKEFFSLHQELYKFLQKGRVAEEYKGSTFKRLLDQRWSGHYESVMSFLKNADDIRDMLVALTESTDSTVRVKAVGLQVLFANPAHDVVAKILNKVFEIVHPLNLQLQQKKVDIERSLLLVRTTVELLEALYREGPSAFFLPDQVKKIRVTFGRVSFVRETRNGGELPAEKVEEIFEAILKPVIAEMRARFSEQNSALLKALTHMVPSDAEFLNFEKLQPILAMAKPFVNGQAAEEWKAELTVAKAVWKRSENENPDADKIEDLQGGAAFFFGFDKSLPNVATLFKMALTVGTSSATVERGFSTLTRILRPTRIRMTHETFHLHLGL